MFLLLDKPNMDADMQLASHVTHVHIHMTAPDLGFVPVNEAVLRYAWGRQPAVAMSVLLTRDRHRGALAFLRPQWLHCGGAQDRADPS